MNRMLTPLRRLVAVLACMFAIMLGITPAPGPSGAQASSTSCLPSLVKQRLSQIRQKFGPVRIISTFRRGALIAGTGRRSYHANCRAVDFAPPRGKYSAVVAWLKANHSGGVGTYSCGMQHIHIDNGPHVRYHHCVTASGRPTRSSGKSRYASKKSRGTTVASRSRSSRQAAKRTRSRQNVAASDSSRPRITRARPNQRPKRLAEPKKLHFDLHGYTLVN